MHDLFVFEQTGLDGDHRATGRFMSMGIRPQCLEQLRTSGAPLPPALFERRELTPERVDTVAPAIPRRSVP
jgi:hypothetical protein